MASGSKVSVVIGPQLQRSLAVEDHPVVGSERCHVEPACLEESPQVLGPEEVDKRRVAPAGGRKQQRGTSGSDCCQQEAVSAVPGAQRSTNRQGGSYAPPLLPCLE